MILRATFEAIPETNQGGVELAQREVSVEAGTFDECMAAARALLAEGERMITVRVPNQA